MELHISPCQQREFSGVLAELDREFIHGKGRKVSLAKRFPPALGRNHAANLLLARAGTRAVGALAIKPFRWISNDVEQSGAMIGMVYTHPDWRGRGIATRLLHRARERMLAKQYAFAVLWSTQPGFYARLGWMARDSGQLATIPGSVEERRGAKKIDASAFASIEASRRRFVEHRVMRTELDYRVLPVPAERLDFYPGRTGYAIAGARDGTGFLYEMLAEDDELPELWRRIRSSYRQIFVNESFGSAAFRFLIEHAGVRFSPQNLALWLPLAGEDTSDRFSRWHVPFLDRI